MITITERAKRSLMSAKRTFWLVVVILSLAFCLTGQMMLSLYSFYQTHRGVIGDEVSIFVDSSLGEKRTQEVLKQIQKVSPSAVIREIKAQEVLEKDILKLVEGKKKVPLILAMQFPSSATYAKIYESAELIKKIKGVEAVAANFEWIKKRHSLREAIAIGIGALAVPTILLVCVLIYQTGLRLRTFMREEQSLLMTLGASTFSIRGPQMLLALIASAAASVIGCVLLAVTIWVSVPLLESAFEVTLMPPWHTTLGICLLIAVLMIFLTVLSSYFVAGQVKPQKF